MSDTYLVAIGVNLLILGIIGGWNAWDLHKLKQKVKEQD